MASLTPPRARTSDDNLGALLASLPPGRIWRIPEESRTFFFLRGLAVEFARMDNVLRALWGEGDPRTSEATLTDWERVLGLPECSTLPDDTDERRSLAWAKLVARGGSSPAYFEGIGRAAGYAPVRVEEAALFTAGAGECGAPLYGEGWAFTWRLVLTSPAPWDRFEAGTGACGDALVDWHANANLACLIEKIRPAHTTAIVAYEEP